jgi:hypothetical protein
VHSQTVIFAKHLKLAAIGAPEAESELYQLTALAVATLIAQASDLFAPISESTTRA